MFYVTSVRLIMPTIDKGFERLNGVHDLNIFDAFSFNEPEVSHA